MQCADQLQERFQNAGSQKIVEGNHLPGNHYVVVCDANEDVVIVGDPAVGVIQHSRSQFRQAWNGKLLLLNLELMYNTAVEFDRRP